MNTDIGIALITAGLLCFLLWTFFVLRKKYVSQNVSETGIMGNSISNELFAVTIFSDGPGKTNPENRFMVPRGLTLTIFFIPDPGCAVATVFVDGMPTKDYNRENNSYTFSSVTEKHVIRIEFTALSGNV